MKIRIGFVSNSSSSSFLLGAEGDIKNALINYFANNKEKFEEFFKGKKTFDGWDNQAEKWFTIDYIISEISGNAELLGDKEITGIIREVKHFVDNSYEGSEEKVQPSGFSGQFQKLLLDLKAKGFKLYRVTLETDIMPNRFIEDFIFYFLGGIDQDDLYLNTLPTES